MFTILLLEQDKLLVYPMSIGNKVACFSSLDNLLRYLKMCYNDLKGISYTVLQVVGNPPATYSLFGKNCISTIHKKDK
jgi:hypothetical protein